MNKRPRTADEFEWAAGIRYAKIDAAALGALRLALGRNGRSAQAEAFFERLPFELGYLAAGKPREIAASRDQLQELERAGHRMRQALGLPGDQLRALLHAHYQWHWITLDAEIRPAAARLPQALAELDALLAVLVAASGEANADLASARGDRHDGRARRAQRAYLAKVFAEHFPSLSTSEENKHGPFSRVLAALRDHGLLD